MHPLLNIFVCNITYLYNRKVLAGDHCLIGGVGPYGVIGCSRFLTMVCNITVQFFNFVRSPVFF